MTAIQPSLHQCLHVSSLIITSVNIWKHAALHFGLVGAEKKKKTSRSVKEIPDKQQWGEIFKEKSGDSKSDEDSLSPSVTGLCWRLQISQDRSGTNKQTATQDCLEETLTVQTVPTSLPKWIHVIY